MPTLLDQDFVLSAAADNTTLTSKSFTVSNGDVFAAKVTTWDTANGMGTVTGGGLTWTKAVEAKPGGFNGYAAVWVVTVSGSPGTMSVSAPPGTAGNTRHSLKVEQWGSAKLAGSPAVNSTLSGSGAPLANITTAANNSIVTWCETDVASVDPTSRTYRLSATEDGIYDGHVGSNSVQEFAYASVGAAGTYAMGMSAPGSQTWVLAGVEIQAGGTTQSFDSAVSETATISISANSTKPVDVAIATTASISATSSQNKPVDSVINVVASISATASVVKPIDISLSIEVLLVAGEPGTGSLSRIIDQSSSGRITSQTSWGRAS